MDSKLDLQIRQRNNSSSRGRSQTGLGQCNQNGNTLTATQP